MIKLNNKNSKELILSGKNLKQSEFDTIRNRSEEFKNIVFRKRLKDVQRNHNAGNIDNISVYNEQIEGEINDDSRLGNKRGNILFIYK